jgi:hypothetical protein
MEGGSSGGRSCAWLSQGPVSRDPSAAVRRFVVDQSVAARLDAPDATVQENKP